MSSNPVAGREPSGDARFPTSGVPSYEAPPSGSGGAGCFGVLAGLGAAGMVATLVGGGAISLVVLGVTAWLSGWFSPPSEPVIALKPVKIHVAQQKQLKEASPLLGGDQAAQTARREILHALDALGAELGPRCKASGPVVGEVLVDEAGTIIQATLDEGYQASADCVANALQGKKVPNSTQKPARARVAFHLGG